MVRGVDRHSNPRDLRDQDRRVPFFKSRPSLSMLAVPTGAAIVGAILPYTGLAHLLGFTPLPARFFLLLFGMVVVYLLLVELAKTRFYAAPTPGLLELQRPRRTAGAANSSRASRFTHPAALAKRGPSGPRGSAPETAASTRGLALDRTVEVSWLRWRGERASNQQQTKSQAKQGLTGRAANGYSSCDALVGLLVSDRSGRLFFGHRHARDNDSVSDCQPRITKLGGEMMQSLDRDSVTIRMAARR